jgi:hypothetical protein
MQWYYKQRVSDQNFQPIFRFSKFDVCNINTFLQKYPATTGFFLYMNDTFNGIFSPCPIKPVNIILDNLNLYLIQSI